MTKRALLVGLAAVAVLAGCGGERKAEKPAGGSTPVGAQSAARPAADIGQTPPSVPATPTAGPAASTEAAKPDSPDASQKAGFDAGAEYDKGEALAAARRFDDARQVFEAAARRAPQEGSLSAAAAIFAELSAKRISEDVVQRLFRAGQHANADRWTEAYADVDEAIRLAPGYTRAHGLRGTLLLQQGKPADALKAFEQVLKLDPNFAEGHYNRGATYAALGQPDKAIADFSRAIELQPNYWETYANRGLTYQSRGTARENLQDMQAAMADYTKAHELNPAAVEPYISAESCTRSPSNGTMRRPT